MRSWSASSRSSSSRVDRRLRPRLVGEVGQWLSSPERERLPQHPVRLRRRSGPRIPHELLEAVQVERPGIGTKLVRGGDGPDHARGPERPAELRDVRLQYLRGRRRRPAAPELLDQAIARDRLVGAEEQDRKQGPRLRCIQRDDAALGDHLERSEDAELHAPIVPERRAAHKEAAASTGARPWLDRAPARSPHRETTTRRRDIA